MMIFNPNCSELVVKLNPNITKREAVAELAKIGIFYLPYLEDFWSFGDNVDDNVYRDYLVDFNNPFSPDYTHHATVCLNVGDIFDSGESYVYIMANQHCQSQMFETLKKISDLFNEDVHAYDGGSIDSYDEWVRAGSKPNTSWDLSDEIKLKRARTLVKALRLYNSEVLEKKKNGNKRDTDPE